MPRIVLQKVADSDFVRVKIAGIDVTSMVRSVKAKKGDGSKGDVTLTLHTDILSMDEATAELLTGSKAQKAEQEPAAKTEMANVTTVEAPVEELAAKESAKKEK